MANNDKHTLAGEMPGNVVFGIQGESAYQVAVRNGFEGTEEEWLKSLSGPAGVGITDMYDMHASQSAAGTQSLAGKRHTLTVNLSDGTARSFPFKDGDNGQRGRGVYPWDLNASSSFVDDEGITHYRDGVTLPDGVVLLDGDLLLTGTGDVYRVEQWNNIYGMTVKHLYNIAGSAPGSGGNTDQNGGLTTAQIAALDGMFKVCAYDDSTDVSGAYAAFKTAFGITDSGEEEPDEPVVPDEPDTPEITLSSISATYSGGDVAVGTAVTALTGIVVTAHYSDGSTETVTGYTLSGTIAEGSNTVTVSYGGKSTTFSVTGVAESGGDVVSMGSWKSVQGSLYDWTSDAGATAFSNNITQRSAAQLLTSVNVFDTDTKVSIHLRNNGSAYDKFNIASLGEYKNMTYTEECGANTWASFDRTVEYTVKAGHYLAITSLTSSTTVDVAVTVLEDLGTGSAPVYVNMISEDDLNQIPTRVIPYSNIYTDNGNTVTTNQSDMHYFTLPESGRYRITATEPTNETLGNFMAYVAVGTLNDDGTVYNAHYYATIGQNIIDQPFYIDYAVGQIVMIYGNTDANNAKKWVAHKL